MNKPGLSKGFTQTLRLLLLQNIFSCIYKCIKNLTSHLLLQDTHKQQQKNNVNLRVGFTMFELFFVMAVIGVIIVLSVIALDKIKSDSRDKQRVSQVQSFINAFEIYYSEYGEYPSGDISTVDRTPVTIDVAAKTLADSGFLQSVPEDPIYVGTDGYLYCTTPDNKTMAIIVNIENSSGTSHCVVSRGVDVYSADLCPVVQLLDKCNGGF